MDDAIECRRLPGPAGFVIEERTKKRASRFHFVFAPARLDTGMQPTRTARVIEAGIIGVLLAIAVSLLFFDLGASSFHDVDEALYAQVAREMWQSGDRLTPTFWGEPFLHKPPLAYWLIGLVNEWLPGLSPELQSRLPSALAALALVALVYWSAGRLAGPVAAGIAALLLLVNPQFLYEHGARPCWRKALRRC